MRFYNWQNNIISSFIKTKKVFYLIEKIDLIEK